MEAMMNTRTRSEQARYTLERLVADMGERIQNFGHKLLEAEHPLDVLSWAEEDVRNVAMHAVYRRLLAMAPADAVQVARDQMVRGAKWIPSSTSTMSNLMKLYETSAYATFVHEWAEALLGVEAHA
jgi:hypothetical protein